MVARGEIWLAKLDPTVGSEIRKTRPCLILSPQEMNNSLRTVLAAPLTSGNKSAPFRVDVNFAGTQGLILLDHIRSVDKARLVKKLGVLDHPTFLTTLNTLQDIFAE